MDMQLIANIAETIGAIVVVITLIYLTVQLRQNNALLRSQSRQAQLTNDQTALRVMFEQRDIVQKMSDDDVLSVDEQFKLSIVYLIDMRNREFEYFQYRDGLLDEASWASFREIVAINHGTRKGRLWWEKVGRTIFDADFVADIDVFLKNVENDDRMSMLSKWDA